ncbi:MAG: hypothetical protein IJ681_00660 [Bacteroidales bacterium]|nr:hypothetical protein [Bacteroidales bacterium]
MANKVDVLLSRHQKLKSEKATLHGIYELISEYVFNKKYNLEKTPNGGIFVDGDIYDNTGLRANSIMANVMVNNLWPNGPRTFKVKPTWDTSDTQEIKAWFKHVNSQMHTIMDNTRAGLVTALDEYMLDQGSFGISGIYVSEDETDLSCPIRYTAWDIKSMCVDEGTDGLIDTVFVEIEMTIRNAVKEYGLENLGSKTQKAFLDGNLEDKIKVLHVIEPRLDRNPKKYGAKDMPIASIHIEICSRKIIKESGFEEMPVFVGRFIKVLGEKYGRSPAMVAMPDILEANATREAISIATEKQLDPPLAVYDDGSLGAGTIETSAGAINVFSVSGRINNGKPIEPLYTVGELQSSYNHIETLKESINNHFYLDRLLDFNNETRMTFGEAQLRNALRGQSLGTFYARQEMEVITPMIKRTFNILLKRGLFGVLQNSIEELELLKRGIRPIYIPEEIAQRILSGLDVYDLDFISPAKRTMQSEELQGTIETANFAVSVAAAVPEILDNIDTDEMLRRIAKLSGADEDMLKDMQTVQSIRKARAEQQAQIMQLEQARQQSEIGRNVAQINSMQNANNGAAA